METYLRQEGGSVGKTLLQALAILEDIASGKGTGLSLVSAAPFCFASLQQVLSWGIWEGGRAQGQSSL